MQQYADIYSLHSHFAVNKCLHTVASSWTFLLTLNHDARNHEFKNPFHHLGLNRCVRSPTNLSNWRLHCWTADVLNANILLHMS